MPRPTPVTSSSGSDSNSEPSVTDEVDLIVGDLYSSDVIEHVERPRLLSFSNTFEDLELRCVCRTGKCRYSWPQRMSERPMYTCQPPEPSSSVKSNPPPKNHSNKKENVVFSTIRNIVSSASSSKKACRPVKESSDQKITGEVKFESELLDEDSDSEPSNATCDLTLPLQSYLDSYLRIYNQEISSSSESSNSDAVSTDSYSDEEFRRIAEIGRTANLTELKLVEIITSSPLVRLLSMEMGKPTEPTASTSPTRMVITDDKKFSHCPSKTSQNNTGESCSDQHPLPSKTKKKKRYQMLPKSFKINKPKFLKNIINEKNVPETGEAIDTDKNKTNMDTKSNFVPNADTLLTAPIKNNPNTENDQSLTVSSKHHQGSELFSTSFQDTKEHMKKDTTFDKRELFKTGSSNIHDYVVREIIGSGSSSCQKSSISSVSDSDTGSEVEEDEVRSIAHDLRSLTIIPDDSPIRLIGFGKLDDENNLKATGDRKLSLYKPIKHSKFIQNSLSKVDNEYFCEGSASFRQAESDDSDVNTSDSEDDDEGWRAVYDFTKPVHRNFTPEWSSDFSSDLDTSDNSDIFSSDDDNLDLNYSYNVLDIRKPCGLTKSENLRDPVSIKLTGFSSINL